MKSAGIKPNLRYLTILSTLVNEGLTPWGANLGDRAISLCSDRYILCDGYTLTPKEAQEFVDAKLLEAGEPDNFGRSTLVVTEVGRRWLIDNWK
jgi:hypothetical protein